MRCAILSDVHANLPPWRPSWPTSTLGTGWTASTTWATSWAARRGRTRWRRAGYVVPDTVAPGVEEEATGSDGPDPTGGPRDAGSSRWNAVHVRIEYDVERAVRGIEESGLPDAFADHLQRGST